MNRFILKNIFIKVYIPLFHKYFYNNKWSKLCFGDRVVILNVKFYGYGGKGVYMPMIHKSILSRGCWNLMLMPRSRDVGLDSSRKKLKGYTHACVSESKDCSRVNKREES